MVPTTGILWVLWKHKLHQLTHLFFSSHGNHEFHVHWCICSLLKWFAIATLFICLYGLVEISYLVVKAWCIFFSCTGSIIIEFSLLKSIKLRSFTWVLFCRYSGRGLFLDPPTVYIKNKSANLSLPPSIMHDQLSSCDTCQ